MRWSNHPLSEYPLNHLILSILKKEKLPRQRHQHLKSVFCATNSINTLAYLLKTDKRKLLMMAKQPRYRQFSVSKKGGGERAIEAPFAELKKIQSQLSNYLQSVYYFEKSSASYGFIVGVRNEDDRRNVLTNAKKHLHQPYMVNIDLKDFFHTITRRQVVKIFENPPFKFRRSLPDLLANLTTFQDRLPMGTPTSPVLSNFACRQLDAQLIDLAQKMGWTFTRYADDMTFSSKKPINAQQFNVLKELIISQGFIINERKLKFYGPDDQKIVTGLLIADTVSLAPDYLPTLEKDIQKLRAVMHTQNEQGQFSTRWVEQFKKQLRGRLSFAGFVLKPSNQIYIQLKDAFYEALNPPEEEFSAVSWRGFPYNI